MRLLLQRCFETPQPHLGQQPVILSVGNIQGVEIGLPKLRSFRDNWNAWKTHYMKQRNKKHAANSSVEISKRMNRLKPSVSHSQQFSDRSHIRLFRPDMLQSRGEIIAE